MADPYVSPWGNPLLQRASTISFPDAPAVEQSNMLESLGANALSGLGYVGGSLSKAFGGRAIRGLLGGKPEELLSIIPFSDTMGITNPANEVHGAELIGGDKDTPFFSAQGIGGLGVDILLDPATFFGGAIMKGIGKGAQLAGKSAARVAPKTSAAVSHAASTLSDPFRRAFAKAFDARVRGQFDDRMQDVARGVTESVAPSAHQQMQKLSPLIDDLQRELGWTGGPLPPMTPEQVFGHVRDLRMQLEGNFVGPMSPRRQALIDKARTLVRSNRLELEAKGLSDAPVRGIGYWAREGTGLDPLGATARGKAFSGPVALYTEGPRSLNELARNAAKYQGMNAQAGPLAVAEDFLGYGPAAYNRLLNLRQRVASGAPLNAKAEKQLEKLEGIFGQAEGLHGWVKGLDAQKMADQGGFFVNHPFADMENKLLKDAMRFSKTGGPLAGLAKSMNDLSLRVDHFQNPLLSVADGTKEIARDYFGYGPKRWTRYQNLQQKLAAGNPLTDVEQKQLARLSPVFTKSGHMLDWVRTLHPQEVKDMGGFFAAQKAGIPTAIAKVAELAANTTYDAIPISDMLIQAKMVRNGAAHPQAKKAVLEALRQESRFPNAASLTMKDLDNFMVPKEIAPSVAKLMQAAVEPTMFQPVLDLFDSITNLTKNFQVPIWPAAKTRNQVEAITRNWINDAFDPTAPAGPMQYIAPMFRAWEWNKGETIKGIAKMPEFVKLGLTDAQATAAFNKKIFEWQLASREKLPSYQIAGAVSPAGKEMPTIGVTRGSVNPLTRIKEAIPRSRAEMNPLNTLGVGGRTEDVFAPVKAGRGLDAALDEMNRVSVFYAKKMQGAKDIDAYKAAIAAHGDFNNLTEFEKKVMRRLIPYYSWQRQMIPQVVKELVQNPGGKTGMVLRTLNEASGHKQGFRPDYLGQGMAAPLGQESPEGKQNYLSSLGLSVEDLGNYTRGGNVLGMLNPIPKGILEYMTGKQFYTGRDLSGTVPHTGSVEGDLLVQASPLGRFGSTYRMLTDDRGDALTKAMNFLTGMRVSTVDMNAARQQAIRELAERELGGQEGVGKFQKLFVRPEVQALLSPREAAIYRLYQQSQRDAQKQRQQQR